MATRNLRVIKWLGTVPVVGVCTLCNREFKVPTKSLSRVADAQQSLRRGAPQSITVDNGTEFASKAMELWAYRNAVHLDFIRPGKPVENGYIESFNGKLRDEFLNVEVLFTLADARNKLERWLRDYNSYRPHSALADRTPAEFAVLHSGGKDGDEAALENASRFPLSHRTAAGGIRGKSDQSSSPLLEIVT